MLYSDPVVELRLLLYKLESMKHLHRLIYLVSKLSLISASNFFFSFIKKYLQVFHQLFLLKFFQKVNLKIFNQTIHQHPLLKESLILVFRDQDRFNHRLHIVNYQNKVRSLHYCVTTSNQNHLPLIFFLLFSLIFHLHSNLPLVLKPLSLFIQTVNIFNLLKTKTQFFHCELSKLLNFHIVHKTKTLDLLDLVPFFIHLSLIIKRSIIPDKFRDITFFP